MLLKDVLLPVKLKPKKSKNNLKWILLIFIVLGGGFFIYQNRLYIWLYFTPKEETELIEKAKIAKSLIREKAKLDLTVEEIRQEKEILELRKFLEAYEKAHPLEPLIYATNGLLEYEFFLIPIARNKSFYDDLLFLVYLERYQFLSSLDFSLWQKTILLLRKSLIFSLPEEIKNEVKVALATLYLWGGKSYWTEAYELLKEQEENTVRDLLNIVLLEKPPRFDQLVLVFPKESVELWKAMYYLKAGNWPVGYSLLNKLTELPQEDPIRDKALYLLANLQKRQNLLFKQLYYLKKINGPSFQKTYRWFKEEFVNLLRFFGEYEKANQFLKDVENL